MIIREANIDDTKQIQSSLIKKKQQNGLVTICS